MLQRFNRQRRNTDAMENWEGHFRLNYKETDEVASWVTQVALEIVWSNKRKKTQRD